MSGIFGSNMSYSDMVKLGYHIEIEGLLLKLIGADMVGARISTEDASTEDSAFVVFFARYDGTVELMELCDGEKVSTFMYETLPEKYFKRYKLKSKLTLFCEVLEVVYWPLSIVGLCKYCACGDIFWLRTMVTFACFSIISGIAIALLRRIKVVV